VVKAGSLVHFSLSGEGFFIAKYGCCGARLDPNSCQKECRVEWQNLSECQNRCQIECQKERQIECQKERQIECQSICQKECQSICQKECQYIYAIYTSR